MATNYYTNSSQDSISASEQELYNLIMAYRASLGLPAIAFSESLSTTAARHALDTIENVGAYAGHSWSDAPYDSANAATYPNMWNAPTRVGTPYNSNGYEITTGQWGAGGITNYNISATEALNNWKGSAPHNEVITNTGIWANIEWKAIGIGMYKGIAHVWFGEMADPLGEPVFENGGGGGGGAGSTIDATLVPEIHEAGNGATLVRGTPTNLLGDTVRNFGTDDTIRFTQDIKAFAQIAIANGLVTVVGGAPTALTLQGDFSGGRFFGIGTADKQGMDLFFAKTLEKSAFVEGRAVDAANVNGGPHLSGLTGDGTREFVVTLDSAAKADFRNALGVYEVRPDGTIADVRLLFSDVSANPTASITVGGVDAGSKLGFFIVQNASPGAGAALSFVDGGAAGMRLHANGADTGATVFHSFSSAFNPGGQVHARSGADPDGTGFLVAFEDKAGGDRDFQDVVFHVDISENGMIV